MGKRGKNKFYIAALTNRHFGFRFIDDNGMKWKDIKITHEIPKNS
jgi:uncharacterized protein (UPF0128 family)